MSDFLTTEPKPSDTKNNLLAKWCEAACGPGVAKFADSDNDLLKKILVCTVNGGSGGDGDPPVGDPVVDFEADVTVGFAPLLVNFTNLSVGDFVSYEWDFGDGNTSTSEDPSHTYSTGGAYTVTLTGITADDEVVEIKTDYITVLNAPFLILESDLGITTVVGALYEGISLWEDQTVNNNDVSQADEARRGELIPNVLNGYPAVRFESVTRGLERVGLSHTGVVRTYHVVFKYLALTPATLQNILNTVEGTLGKLSDDSWFMASAIPLVAPSPAVDTNTHYVTAVFNESNSKFYLDGVLIASGEAGSDSPAGLFLNDVVNLATTCDIFRVYFFSGALNDAGRLFMESNSTTKYNL